MGLHHIKICEENTMTAYELDECIVQLEILYRTGDLDMPDNTKMYDAFITAITPKD